MRRGWWRRWSSSRGSSSSCRCRRCGTWRSSMRTWRSAAAGTYRAHCGARGHPRQCCWPMTRRRFCRCPPPRSTRARRPGSSRATSRWCGSTRTTIRFRRAMPVKTCWSAPPGPRAPRCPCPLAQIAGQCPGLPGQARHDPPAAWTSTACSNRTPAGHRGQWRTQRRRAERGSGRCQGSL